MGLSLTTEPTDEPVTLDETKKFLRLTPDQNYDDDDLVSLITDARQYVEQYLRRQLMPATFTLAMDRFPYLTILDPQNQANPKFDNANYYYGSPDRFAIWVPRPPLVAITSITYVDNNDAVQTLATTNYVVDAVGEPGRIAPTYGQFWPGSKIKPNAVTIVYTAGYASAKLVPGPIKRAIKQLVSHWYYDSNSESGIPKGIRDTLYPYRILDERTLEYA